MTNRRILLVFALLLAISVAGAAILVGVALVGDRPWTRERLLQHPDWRGIDQHRFPRE
ncbi:hypothetical protein HL658_30735 [Azospirillum sp. RWY-5-1]|uniref:Uncharacterized protein n=1 Tax=Azospirillum oleiclasticum TaxID=2735135 RepID=A0ABX2TCI0_9PROT|nr:hypothetical protein [Azospirillum oleiclasticum]NYZ16942.1 hypothetical protein [Azospirillum oleiclasticum]NYZ21879.1 hypothetical protein [Azospirillum oleiclasticum]